MMGVGGAHRKVGPGRGWLTSIMHPPVAVLLVERVAEAWGGKKSSARGHGTG